MKQFLLLALLSVISFVIGIIARDAHATGTQWKEYWGWRDAA